MKKVLNDWLTLLKTKKSSWRSFIAFCLIFCHAFCYSIPVSHAFSITEEKELGDKLLYSVRSAFNLLDDPDIHQYINELGKEVLGVTGVQFFNYHFFIINNKEFNAFAAPSGLVFFYSGLIGAMNSEDELVSVLAHEIGHVVKRHLAARMEKGTVSAIATGTLALAGILVGGPLAPALVTGAMATGQSINLSYSRTHEEEADLLAYGWMKKLHRDSEGQLKMLNTMRRVARYRSEELPQYLLTHPNPEARLNYVESLVLIDKNKGVRAVTPRDNFDFFRFKYRIMAEVKENGSFRDLLISQVTSPRSSDFERKMAEYGLALVAIKQNDATRSLKYLNSVIENFPDKLSLIGDRGYIQLEAGNLDAAESDLRYVLTKDPRNLFATFNLGRVMSQKGNLDEAEKYFKTVLYDIPEYSKAYYELGRLSNARKEQGTAAYYLGKYNLYLGKLKIATFNFEQALKSRQTPVALKKDSEELLVTIEELEKG